MALDQEAFRQKLVEDVRRAKQTARQSAEAAGRSGVSEDFTPRALRVKKKTFGQSQLKSTESAINKAIKQLEQESNIIDQIEKKKFQFALKDKLNKMRLQAIRKSAELDKRLAKMGVEAKKRRQAQQKWANIMEAVGAGIVSNIGPKKDNVVPDISEGVQASETGFETSGLA